MKIYEIPKEQPVYDFVKPKKKKRAFIYMMLDRFLTAYGFILVFAYTILLLWSSFAMKFSSIGLFIVFWFLLTYIALPRLHSFFASIYLPDYFLSRTKTGDGILGDPVNMAIIGTEEDIHAVMKKSGWTKADPITLRSSLGIVISTIRHTSYPEAPVSSLYLFNKKQDFAYQMEVNGSASKRHHVRFWKVPEGWSLPGGKKVEWLAAGTFDTGVGFTSSTLQITHKIDKYVDKERDFIIESMLYVDNDITVDVIKEFVIPYSDQNGGGDSIETDGDMPIVNLIDSSKRIPLEKEIKQIEKKEDKLDKELPPKSLLFIGAMIFLKLLLSVLGMVSVSFIESSSAENMTNLIIMLLYFTGTLIELVFYILTIKKFKWGRMIFLMVASLSCTSEIITLFGNSTIDISDLIRAGISISVVLIFSSLDIREWVYTVHKRGE